MIDSQRQIETPEGVELSLPLAGPVARARAWLLDLAIKAALLWCAGIGLALFGSLGASVYFVLIFLVTWFYSVFFEVLRNGATPGKRAAGLRVVHDNGTPIGWSASVTRSLLGFVDALPFCYGVGLVTMLAQPSFKRLGDLASGTVVVHVAPAAGPATATPDVPAESPPFPLRPEEQRALVDFADRAALLTPERQRELADLALPLSGGGSNGVRRLLGQAAWIAGRR